MKFRKKPVIIEATQWFQNGDHPDDGMEMFKGEGGVVWRGEGRVVRYCRYPGIPGDSPCFLPIQQCGRTMHEHGQIGTPTGNLLVCPGDWIVTGPDGAHFPVKPHIFRETYEKVDA